MTEDDFNTICPDCGGDGCDEDGQECEGCFGSGLAGHSNPPTQDDLIGFDEE